MCSLWEDYSKVIAEAIRKSDKGDWEPCDDFGSIQQFVEEYEKRLLKISCSGNAIALNQKIPRTDELENNTEANTRLLKTTHKEVKQRIPQTSRIERKAIRKETNRLTPDVQKQERLQSKSHHIGCRQTDISTPRPKTNTTTIVSHRDISHKDEASIRKSMERKSHLEKHSRRTESPIAAQSSKPKAPCIGNSKIARKEVISFRKPIRNVEHSDHHNLRNLDDNSDDFILKYVIEQVQNLPKEVYDQCVHDRYQYLEKRKIEALNSKKHIGAGSSNQIRNIKKIEHGKTGTTRRK
eukprot:Tbor_TRINITY_DN5169_c0_g1::TRINITY_DN5169_c0_g1_i1::g.26049::m.26049